MQTFFQIVLTEKLRTFMNIIVVEMIILLCPQSVCLSVPAVGMCTPVKERGQHWVSSLISLHLIETELLSDPEAC